MGPVLSVLVITHNQRDLLMRCFSSVITQEIDVPFEIVISDDRSSDGTDSYVHSLKAEFEGKKRNLTQIKYVRCNSDECNPLTVSDRCGWNKLSAYRQAEGKYFVNIDADDYLRSTDIYQLQIQALEAHPECSMCMQRAWMWEPGTPLENGQAFPINPLLKNMSILSQDVFLRNHLQGVNPTYMIRRCESDDMQALYGKWFDDTIITLHHLQYGPVIFIDRTDYVWVQYNNSISHTMSEDDVKVIYGLLPLHHAELIPSLRITVLQSGLSSINHTLKITPEYPYFTDQYKKYISQFPGFIYRYYTSPVHGFLTKCRFWISRVLLHLGVRFSIQNECYCRLMYRIIV